MVNLLCFCNNYQSLLGDISDWLILKKYLQLWYKLFVAFFLSFVSNLCFVFAFADLHEFLTSVYAEYDIMIWSATKYCPFCFILLNSYSSGTVMWMGLFCVTEWMVRSLSAAWSGLTSRWGNLGFWIILTTKSPHFLTTWQWSLSSPLLVGSLIASLLVWSGPSSLRYKYAYTINQPTMRLLDDDRIILVYLFNITFLSTAQWMLTSYVGRKRTPQNVLL